MISPEKLRRALVTALTRSPKEGALALASAGVEIYPAKHGTHIPLDIPDPDNPSVMFFGRDKDENGNYIQGSGGVNKATNDIHKVEIAWNRYPNADIEIKIPEQYAVIDKDRHSGDSDGVETFKAIEAKYGKTFDSFTSSTPRNGRHVWVLLVNNQKLRAQDGIFKGIDIKVAGDNVREGTGYKVHIDMPIAEMPPWVYNDFKLAQTPKEEPENLAVSSALNSAIPQVVTVEGIGNGVRLVETGARWFEKKISSLLERYNNTTEKGCRNRNTRNISFAFGQIVRTGSITNEWAKDRIKDAVQPFLAQDFTWQEAEGVIDKGLRDGYAQPMIHKWKEEEQETSNPFEFLSHIEDYTYGNGIYAGEPPDYDWCFDGLVERGNIAVVGGAGSTGKSTIMAQGVSSIATGKKWLDTWETGEPEHAIYMSSEDTAREQHRRAKAIASTLTKNELKHFSEFAHFKELKGRAALLRQDSKTLQVSPTPHWNYFYDSICKLRPKLVVIDPISAVTLVNENDNTAMTDALIYLEELARESNSTIAFIHHTSKNDVMIQQKEKIAPSMVHSAIRGAGAIVNRPRLAMLGCPLSAKLSNLLIDGDELPLRFDGELICFRDVKKNCGPLGPIRYFRHTSNKGLLVPCARIKEEAAYLVDKQLVKEQRQEQELDDMSRRLAQEAVRREIEDGALRIPASGAMVALGRGVNRDKSAQIAIRAEDLGLVHRVGRAELRRRGFGNKISGNGGGDVLLPSIASLENAEALGTVPGELVAFIEDIERGCLNASEAEAEDGMEKAQNPNFEK